MKLLRVKVHNVMGLRDVDIDLSGHHLFLVGGKNGSGKSSTLKSVVMALCGKSGCDWPDEPVRNGANEASIEVFTTGSDDLFQDNLRIERKWVRQPEGKPKEEFRIVGDDGFEAPEPITLLRRLYKHRAFDPLGFLRMKPKEQLEELRKIVGLDFDELNDRRKTLYDQRALVNRQGKEMRAKFELMPVHPDAPDEPVQIADLREEWNRRDAINEANDEVRGRATAASLEVSGLVGDLESIEADVKDLEALLKKKKDALAAAKKDHKAAEKRHAKALDEVEKLVDEDLDEIELQIESAEQVNRQVAENESTEAFRSELVAKRKESERLTSEIQAIDEEKSRLVDEAPWPVDGFRYTEDGKLVVGDVPFPQCSTGEKVRVSCQMAIAASPELRLMVIEHGESLDHETLAVIDEVARENEYQILLEYVTRNELDEEKCHVILEDGMVRELEEPATVA